MGYNTIEGQEVVSENASTNKMPSLNIECSEALDRLEDIPMNQSVTIAIATYNSKPKDFFATLYSAVMQEGVDVEIIIVDDGSTTFNPYSAVKLFESIGFSNYQIIASPVNHGTTVNMLNSVNAANGQFYKAISPGDVLYSKTCLMEAVAFMTREQCSVCFGDAVYYENNNGLTVFNLANPTCLTPYDKRDAKRIRRHYLQYHQFALGASFVCKTELIKEYMPLLEDRVKFCEDYAYALMVLDDIELRHWPSYLIWYQYGSGISTSSNEAWAERMQKDALAAQKIANDLRPGIKWGIPKRSFVLRAKRKIFTLRNKAFRRMGIWKKREFDDSFFIMTNNEAERLLRGK